MTRTISRIAALLLVPTAAACGDYSTSSGYHPPPDTTLQNGLWVVSGAQPALVRLSQSQLTASGSVTPATSITSPSGTFSLNSVAFDADGTLWMASPNDSSLLAFRPTALTSSGDRAAAIMISSTNGSLSASSGIAFDASHNLWVANHGNGTIVRFDSAQLVSSGARVPSVVLSGTGHPTGLAFDSQGALWFSDNTANRLAKYSAAQIQQSGFILPQVVLSTNGTSLHNPSGIAFDESGNLWVANTGRTNIVALAASQLDTTGLALPSIVISPSATSPTLPVGIAFDDAGSLWVVYGEGVLAKYPRASLAASGAPDPAVRLVVNNHLQFWTPAFWPTPPALPIN